MKNVHFVALAFSALDRLISRKFTEKSFFTPTLCLPLHGIFIQHSSLNKLEIGSLPRNFPFLSPARHVLVNASPVSPMTPALWSRLHFGV